ncbi:hypothetical protein [Kitasatospora sp. NPDC093679]|uniref:hypothetical protein n=1 Tax=Kitasatospora sp. NPDC093679 TaxID=3154983 RepID=UPI0034347BD4
MTAEHEQAQEASRARRRLSLVADASMRVGTTLDVAATARELADVTVPEVADTAAVDLPDPAAPSTTPATSCSPRCAAPTPTTTSPCSSPASCPPRRPAARERADSGPAHPRRAAAGGCAQPA